MEEDLIEGDLGMEAEATVKRLDYEALVLDEAVEGPPSLGSVWAASKKNKNIS